MGKIGLYLVGLGLCFCLMLASTGASAQQQDTTMRENGGLPQNYEQRVQFEQDISNSSELEIDGLIVDETITKMGRDFYEVFHRQWEAPPMAQNFTIQIREFPARGMGALIQLTVNDQTILEQQLQPKYDLIEEIANYAVGLTYQYLVQDQLQRQLEAEGKKAREVF